MSGNQFWIVLFDDHERNGTLGFWICQGWDRQFGGLREILATQPGVMQGSTAAVFSKDKTICRRSRTFTRKHCSSQADAKTMGFNLHVPFHQDNLELPALQPSDSEGIGHESPHGTRSPYGPA